MSKFFVQTSFIWPPYLLDIFSTQLSAHNLRLKATKFFPKKNYKSFFFIIIINAQKMKFSIKDFFSKCDQISSFLRHLLKKSLMENFIFCRVYVNYLLSKSIDWFLLFIILTLLWQRPLSYRKTSPLICRTISFQKTVQIKMIIFHCYTPTFQTPIFCAKLLQAPTKNFLYVTKRFEIYLKKKFFRLIR